MNPVEFLLARVAEDEARIAQQSPWTDDDDYAASDLAAKRYDEQAHSKHCGCRMGEYADPCSCWWPRRLQQECEAKRRIVEAYPIRRVFRWNPNKPAMPDMTRTASGDSFWTDTGQPITPQQRAYLEETYSEEDVPEVLRLLALPYADHPDFDPAWRV